MPYVYKYTSFLHRRLPCTYECLCCKQSRWCMYTVPYVHTRCNMSICTQAQLCIVPINLWTERQNLSLSHYIMKIYVEHGKFWQLISAWISGFMFLAYIRASQVSYIVVQESDFICYIEIGSVDSDILEMCPRFAAGFMASKKYCRSSISLWKDSVMFLIQLLITITLIVTKIWLQRFVRFQRGTT